MLLQKHNNLLKNLSLFKLRNKNNGMLSFGFVLVLNWYNTYTVFNKQRLSQLLQKKTKKQFFSLCFCIYVATLGQIIVWLVIYFFMWNLLFFMSKLFNQFKSCPCCIWLFLSFKSTPLSATAVRERYVKVLRKIKSNLGINVCFYDQGYKLRLPLYTNIKLVCCLRHL